MPELAIPFAVVETGYPWGFGRIEESDSAFNGRENFGIERIAYLNENLKLVKELDASWEYSDGKFLVCLDEIDVWTYGNNFDDAINELKNIIVSLYYELKDEKEEKLGPLPRNIKKYLKAIISERGNGS